MKDMRYAPDAYAKARSIKLLVLDVDGVMTDGGIFYADSGEELKCFDARDGHGIRLLMRAGIDAAIITGRTSRAVEHRARNLGIATVYQGALNKADAYEDIKRLQGLADTQLCVMGDDLPDLPLLRRCGLAVAVPDSVREVREQADWITARPGGRGAVREVCELLLKAQGLWETVIARYY